MHIDVAHGHAPLVCDLDSLLEPLDVRLNDLPFANVAHQNVWYRWIQREIVTYYEVSSLDGVPAKKAVQRRARASVSRKQFTYVGGSQPNVQNSIHNPKFIVQLWVSVIKFVKFQISDFIVNGLAISAPPATK
jgi:hypothetical protein